MHKHTYSHVRLVQVEVQVHASAFQSQRDTVTPWITGAQ